MKRPLFATVLTLSTNIVFRVRDEIFPDQIHSPPEDSRQLFLHVLQFVEPSCYLPGCSPVLFCNEVPDINQVLAGWRRNLIPAHRRILFPPRGPAMAAPSSRKTSSPSSPSPRSRESSPLAIFAFTSRSRPARIRSAASSNRSASCTTSLADVYLPDFVCP